jgi:hypothetical protein
VGQGAPLPLQHFAAAEADERREQQVQHAVQRLLRQQGDRKRPLNLQPAVQPTSPGAELESSSHGHQQKRQLREALQLRPSTAAGAKDAREAAVGHALPAVREAAATAAEQGCKALASLAVWQRLHVADMAERLIGMTVEQRRQLLGQYADEMAG